MSPSGNNYINFVNASLQLSAISTPQTLAETLPDYGGKSNSSYQALNSLRALHLIKGTVDTMIVECRNSDKANDYATKGWLTVWIDANRNGEFEYEPLTLSDANADDSVIYDYPYSYFSP